MLGITAVFINKHIDSLDLGGIGLCELKLINGKLVWKYIHYSESTINREGKIPDKYSPSVFIERTILQGPDNVAEFKEEDLLVPYTEEVWEKIKKYTW